MARPLTAHLGRPLAPVGVRDAVALVWSRRWPRRALLALLGTVAVLGGGWLVARHTSLSSVERVRISGARGAEAGRIDAALRRAAHGMSTLGVTRGALLAAVAPLHVVRDLRVHAHFPHELRIEVLEQPPVAVLEADGLRTAAAGDGVVLGPELLHGQLPSVRLAGVAPAPGARIADAGARAALRVLGAAPAPLLGWVRTVASGSEGLTVTLRDGLQIYFGDATRPHAKWLAAARVLADPSSTGATYLDVRLPEHPAAGTSAAGGLTHGTVAGSSETTDPNSGALAQSLDEAVAGGASASAPSSTPHEASASQAEAGEASESEAGAASESAANRGESTHTGEAATTVEQASAEGQG
jgi:cell division protein FtsQ